MCHVGPSATDMIQTKIQFVLRQLFLNGGEYLTDIFHIGIVWVLYLQGGKYRILVNIVDPDGIIDDRPIAMRF